MLLIGLAGTELTARERDWLQHDACAGVVLFARNVASRGQLGELCADVRASARLPQLICVDQEGGRVQRLRDGFSALPALDTLGRLYAHDPVAALEQARQHAWLMASEVRAAGIDLSFAPVADVGHDNRAIGSRAFCEHPEVVAGFVRAYVEGMRSAGMAATLKHFPGHGTVIEDTHVDIALDERPLEAIRGHDLVPFIAGIEAGAEAVMLAHVIYPQVAPEPAGQSPFWIQNVLRGEMGFRGVVLSDDIGMVAGATAGTVKARIDAHLDAGCDGVLVCHPELVEDALAAVAGRRLNPAPLASLIGGKDAPYWDTLMADNRHVAACRNLGITEQGNIA